MYEKYKKGCRMNFNINFEEVEYIADVIKIFIIILYTYYTNLKIIDEKIFYKKSILIYYLIFIIMSVVCEFLKNLHGFTYYIICLILMLSLVCWKITKSSIGQSIITTTVSLSINYAIFFASVILSFIPNVLLNVENNYWSLLIILFIYSSCMWGFLHVKRFNKGLIFFKEKLKNDNMDILILNISAIILYMIVVLSNYDKIAAREIGFSLIIFSIIMFISIQKSLQLYYKQKLQEREVEEIKEELKNKDKEIEELEKENLKLNKKNHSIAHKQKSLEYELEQMILNNQIMDGSHVKDKIENLSKEMQNETVSIELTKTNIDEIDNMLKYMQSECEKNKIDFELQINGNIHHMVNKHIEKEDLEILIADMIKNAIIAINHSENSNKSILVRLGLIDGVYSLYVYDSGIEFEIDTLINFGIKPSTTHAKEGGTGMGLMNTFDTLKKYKASLVIDEYGKPVNDNFTKVIKIVFDNKNTYKIVSYRKKDIQEKDINKRVSS